MFIQTEATPNPATLKFLPGRNVMPEGTFDFRDAARRRASRRWRERLFAVPGVDRRVLRLRFRHRHQGATASGST